MTTQNWRSWIFWENPRLPKSSPKWLNLFICLLLQHFLQDWVIIIFLYFAWSWGTISTQNWWSRIFWKKSCLPKSRLKGPKWPNLSICPFVRYYSIFLRIGSLVLLYFAWSWGTISIQNWWGWIFWESSRLPKSGPKRSKMACFVCSSVTTALFSRSTLFFFFFFLIFYTRFYLMTLDSYIRNHILAENMYFTRNIEWTERKIINNYK